MLHVAAIIQMLFGCQHFTNQTVWQKGMRITNVSIIYSDDDDDDTACPQLLRDDGSIQINI